MIYYGSLMPPGLIKNIACESQIRVITYLIQNYMNVEKVEREVSALNSAMLF